MILLVSCLQDDVYLGPKDLDEKVSELHFPALGAELTVLTQATQRSRLKALSRVSTTVIELQSPVEDYLSVLTPVLWSVGAPVLFHAQLASSFTTGSLSSETIVDYPFSFRDGILLRELSEWTVL